MIAKILFLEKRFKKILKKLKKISKRNSLQITK